jgi:hypothetical protein
MVAMEALTVPMARKEKLVVSLDQMQAQVVLEEQPLGAKVARADKAEWLCLEV